jgi:hypothetical protein
MSSQKELYVLRAKAEVRKDGNHTVLLGDTPQNEVEITKGQLKGVIFKNMGNIVAWTTISPEHFEQVSKGVNTKLLCELNQEPSEDFPIVSATIIKAV